MDLGLFLAFVAASALLAMVPGPNKALIVSNSIARGTRYGLLTLLGTSLALGIQLVLVAVGMTTMLAGMGHWFAVMRWIGAAYLVLLGVQAWRAAPPTLTVAGADRRSARTTVLRGVLVSLTNPKLLLFFGAFFPQFISSGHPLAPQLAVMSVTFLLVVVALDCAWALLAGRMRGWIMARGRLLHRISGGLLAGAGIGLAASR